MGGGNAQKSATARARNEAKKAKASKGSQRAINQAACNIVCQVNQMNPRLCWALCFLESIKTPRARKLDKILPLRTANPA